MDPRIPYPDPSSTNSDNAPTATHTARPSASNSSLHGTGASAARRNKPPTTWTHISAAVLESLRDLHYVLSLAGVIEHVSPNSAALLGYSPEQLIGTVLADHVHDDDAPVFRDELREASSTGRPFRFYSRIQTCYAETQATLSGWDVKLEREAGGQPPSPTYSIFEINGRFHQSAPPEPVPVGIGLVATPPSDDGIFVLMARPYPLTQSTKLDSFLSLKIENARLMAQLAELKAEQEGDRQGDGLDADYPEHQQRSMAAPTLPAASFRRPSDGFPWFDVTPSTMGVMTGSDSSYSAQESVFSGSSSMFGPASTNSTNSSVSNMSSLPPPSSANKPGTPLLAGRPLSSTTTSGTSRSPTNAPTIMEGDVGIPFIVKALTGAAGIKKRAKHVEEYVCAWCNTTSSPEWRKGPAGPKSLCNACGLRYAKARRKTGASGSDGGGGDGSGGSNNNHSPHVPATGPDAKGGSGSAGAGAGAGAGSATPTIGPVIA